MKLGYQLLLAGGILVLPVVISIMSLPVQASLIDNATSPFVSESDVGAADNVSVLGTEQQKKDSIINVVKGLVNRVLGIMGLIALIALLYGGFLMVTAAGESERYEKGFTILKHAATGLIMIGAAWFIASIIFWLITQTGNAA